MAPRQQTRRPRIHRPTPRLTQHFPRTPVSVHPKSLRRPVRQQNRLSTVQVRRKHPSREIRPHGPPPDKTTKHDHPPMSNRDIRDGSPRPRRLSQVLFARSPCPPRPSPPHTLIPRPDIRHPHAYARNQSCNRLGQTRPRHPLPPSIPTQVPQDKTLHDRPSTPHSRLPHPALHIPFLYPSRNQNPGFRYVP